MQVQQALTRHTGVSSPVSAADRAEVRCARQPAPRASGAHRDRSHTDQGCPETVLERAISTQGPACRQFLFGISFPFKLGIGNTSNSGPAKWSPPTKLARKGLQPAAGPHERAGTGPEAALTAGAAQRPVLGEAGDLSRHSPSRMVATTWVEGEVSTDDSFQKSGCERRINKATGLMRSRPH